MTHTAQFIAGFAFFLVGIKLFSANLNQLTSQKFRGLITRFTPNGCVASVWGIILSLLTAGNTMLTPCIVGGFRSVNALDLRKSVHMVIWSRVGSCFFIYLAGFNIKVFILFLIGIAGTSFALSKPKRYTTLAASVFSLGLLLFGIQEIKGATKVLTKLEWFSTVIDYTASFPEIAFLAGFLFLLFAQSLFGALVVVLGMLDTGIFQPEQATLFTYGAYLGEAVLKLFYLAALQDAFRQIVSLLPVYYMVAFLVGILSHYLEAFTGWPMLEHVSTLFAADSKQFIAHLNFLVHLITAIILSASIAPVLAYVQKMSTAKDTGRKVQPVRIPRQILDDPITTLALIDQEYQRLVQHLPQFLDNIRTGKTLKEPEAQLQLHKELHKEMQTLRHTYMGLLQSSGYHETVSAKVLHGIERQTLMISLEENIYDFGLIIDKLRKATKDDPELASRFLEFVEALDAVLLTLIDVIVTKEREHLDVLTAITTGRKDMMGQVRERFAAKLDLSQQVDLINLANLFESNIWIIKKLSTLLVTSDEESEDLAKAAE